MCSIYPTLTLIIELCISHVTRQIPMASEEIDKQGLKWDIFFLYEDQHPPLC